MFGSFFQKIGEKIEGTKENAGTNSTAATNDIFSLLSMQTTQGYSPENRTEDPLQYFLSPDPKSNKIPHASKQKPAMMASNDTNQMDRVNLFGHQSQSTTQETAWEQEPSIESSEEEEKQQIEAPSVRKRDYLSNFMSSAGNLLIQGAAKGLSKITAEDEEKIISVLTQENKFLKVILNNQQQKVEDLQDEIEVHKSLEEEAHEQNEELLYKVKYLEELARNNGHDLSSLKRIEELGSEKKTLNQQVASLERQITILEKMKFAKENNSSDTEEENQEMFENPKRTLNDLKSLFEQNQISFNKNDETRVLTAIYIQDKPVIRLYRELLFRRIAQKAIQSAETLFKQTSSLDKDGKQICKVSLENKRLIAQNEALKKKIQTTEEKLKEQSENFKMEKVRNVHKLNTVKDKAKRLAQQSTDIRETLNKLRTQANNAAQSVNDQEVLYLNIQRFSSYLSYFLDQQKEKQVKVKEEFTNKFKLLTQEKQEAHDQSHQVRLQYFEVCQLLDQQRADKDVLQEELGEAHAMISHLEIEMNAQFETISKERADRMLEEAQMQEEIKKLKAQENLLQVEIQNLQSRPQGSPISGGQQYPERVADTSPEQARQAQHISELEKMLEEREEEIIELMAEVNKLQEKEQQSPEVVKTIQILKSKLKNSQQRFQDKQNVANVEVIEFSPVKHASAAISRKEESKSQYVPILIEDQDPNSQEPSGAKSSNGSQQYGQTLDLGSQQHVDLQKNQKMTESFNSNVRDKLEQVLQQRMQQLSPSPSGEILEPMSRIINDGKDSNFLNSMLFENQNSAEKQQPKSDKIDDLFGFLMEPASKKIQESASLNALDNWGTVFGLVQPTQAARQTPTKTEERHLTHAKYSPKLHLDTGTKTGWGEEEDGLDLDEKSDKDQTPLMTYESENCKGETQINIDRLDRNASPTRSQRGEIMFQESLENSPIKPSKSRIDSNYYQNQDDSQRGSFADPNQSQQQLHQLPQLQQISVPSGVIRVDLTSSDKLLFLKGSPDQKVDELIKSDNKMSFVSNESVGSATRHKRTHAHHISIRTKDDFLDDGSIDYVDQDVLMRFYSAEEHENSRVWQVQEDKSDPDASYRTAIQSVANQEEKEQQKPRNDGTADDIDPEIYEQLMVTESDPSQTDNDSLLQTSNLWSNSFTRQETDMVIATINNRRERYNSQDQVQSYDNSPLLNDEKRVNISNLSDLVPEDPASVMMTESQDEYYHRMMRPGELNEVQEEDNEDYSDNLSYNSPRRISGLPTTTLGRAQSAAFEDDESTPIATFEDASNPDQYLHYQNNSEAAYQHERGSSNADQQQHERGDSATILDMQTSSKTQEVSDKYFQLDIIGHKSTPSLMENNKFNTSSSGDGDQQLDQPYEQLNVPIALQEEQSKDVNNQKEDSFKKGGQNLQIEIPEEEESAERVVRSARTDHRSSQNNSENPFFNTQEDRKDVPENKSPESADIPQQKFENLAEFTKENLIKYQASAQTQSAGGADQVDQTADFENSKQSETDLREEQDSQGVSEGTTPNMSGYFQRDFRVLRGATYGNNDGSEQMLKKLREQHGVIDESQEQESYEQNIQSFAEPPQIEQEISACSIDPEQLMGGNFNMNQTNSKRSLGMEEMMNMQMNNSRASFENSNIVNSLRNSINLRDSFQRGSIIENGQLANFLGSMIQQHNGSIAEIPWQDVRREDQLSEEYEQNQQDDDGIPQVDVFTEENNGSDQEVEFQDNKVRNSIEESAQNVEENLSESNGEIGDQNLDDTEKDFQYEEKDAQEAIEEDSQSLETVAQDRSPAKQSSFPQIQETNQVDDEHIIQSNNMDDRVEGNFDDESRTAHGWEDDASLEDIETVREHVVKEMRSEEVLDRSISANEQQVDDVTKDFTEQQEDNDKLVTEEALMTMFEQMKLTTSGKTRNNSEKRQDTPILTVSITLDQQDQCDRELAGWADDSADISLQEEVSPSHLTGTAEQSVEMLKEQIKEVDLSQTQIAEIGQSDKFKCPNNHTLTIVDGKQHPLPSQECSAYCGMSNRQNNKNWLRCRQCFYKVCFDCFHCSGGHELQTAQADDFSGNFTSDEMACASCGNEIKGTLWVCEKIAFAFGKGSKSSSCIDRSLICQECLGSGISFSASASRSQSSLLFDSQLIDAEKPKITKEEQKSLVQEGDHTSQTELSEQRKAVPDLEDLFGLVNSKLPDFSADPFSAFLMSKSAVKESASQAMKSGSKGKEESRAEVDVTGGGWGENEDDIDIDIDME